MGSNSLAPPIRPEVIDGDIHSITIDGKEMDLTAETIRVYDKVGTLIFISTPTSNW